MLAPGKLQIVHGVSICFKNIVLDVRTFLPLHIDQRNLGSDNVLPYNKEIGHALTMSTTTDQYRGYVTAD